MRSKVILLLMIVCSFQLLVAQPTGEGKHSVRFSMGLGYEDGLILIRTVPTIGIGYDYQLSKYFSVSANLLSHYRSMPDSYFNQDINGQLIFDVSAPNIVFEDITGSTQPVSGRGLIPIDPTFTIKSLSLPLDVGITFHPINTKRHLLGIGLGMTMTYSSYNWWRDYLPVSRLVLEDGTVIDQYDLVVSLNTEFHSITTGISTKLLYAYKLNEKYQLGIRVGNYEVFDFGLDAFRGGLAVWDSSLVFTFKL